MLSDKDYKNIKMALRVLHALYTRNPKPVMKLILKQKACKGNFGTPQMINDTAIAISELMLHSSYGSRYPRMAQEISQALKANNQEALAQCVHARDALELIYRTGLLQFDRIVDLLPFDFDNSYQLRLKEQVDGWNRMARPGIHSDKIDPLYYSMYETGQVLRNLKKENSNSPGFY